MTLQVLSTLDIFIRLLLAGVLGGLIGLERQVVKKSAGFRTHVLVCLGSALVMIISEAMFRQYYKYIQVDPARIAAQVVSGIGFLGAGAILREGVNVRGLTTAASLWVVAGIGLAVGAGLFYAAAIATGLVFLALVYLGRFEKLFLIKTPYLDLVVRAVDEPGVIGRIGIVLGSLQVSIKHIEIREQMRESQLFLDLSCQIPRGLEPGAIVSAIAEVSGVYQVTIDE